MDQETYLVMPAIPDDGCTSTIPPLGQAAVTTLTVPCAVTTPDLAPAPAPLLHATSTSTPNLYEEAGNSDSAGTNTCSQSWRALAAGITEDDRSRPVSSPSRTSRTHHFTVVFTGGRGLYGVSPMITVASSVSGVEVNRDPSAAHRPSPVVNVTVTRGPGEAVGVTVVEGVGDGDAPGDMVALLDGVTLGELELVGDGLGDRDTLSELLEEADSAGEVEGDLVTDGDSDGLEVGVRDAVALSLADAVGDTVGDPEEDEDQLSLSETVAVMDTLVVLEGEAVTEAVDEEDSLRVGESDWVPDGLVEED
jgi:hypothetical protein